MSGQQWQGSTRMYEQGLLKAELQLQSGASSLSGGEPLGSRTARRHVRIAFQLRKKNRKSRRWPSLLTRSFLDSQVEPFEPPKYVPS